MYEIHLSNRQQLLPINDEQIREIVKTVLDQEAVVQAEIVVALVDDAAIHVVNREHLQHDYPTDVISFLYDAEVVGNLPESGLRGQNLQIDGELVVSTETAVRESEVYGWDAFDELRLYLVHGLLHLCGYDDLCDSEQAIMRNRERAILKNWNLTPHYS